MTQPLSPSSPLRTRAWACIAVTGATLSLTAGCSLTAIGGGAEAQPSLTTSAEGHRILTDGAKDAQAGDDAQAELSGTLTLSPKDCVVVEDAAGNLAVPMFRGPVEVTQEDAEGPTFTAMGETFRVGDTVQFGGGDFSEPQWAEECGARDTFRVHTVG